MTPIMTPSLGGFLTPILPCAFSKSSDGIKEILPSFIPIKKYGLLNKVSGHGLKMEYRFTRSEHLVNSSMVNIELMFTNESTESISNIRIGNKVC
jgi:AP-3 complex subunit beta